MTSCKTTYRQHLKGARTVHTAMVQAVLLMVAISSGCAEDTAIRSSCEEGTGEPPPSDVIDETIVPRDPAWGRPGFAIETDGKGAFTIVWAGRGVYQTFRGSVFDQDLVLLSAAVDAGVPGSACAVSHDPQGDARGSLPRIDFGPTGADGQFRFTATRPILDILVDEMRIPEAVLFSSPTKPGNSSPRRIPFRLITSLD